MKWKTSEKEKGREEQNRAQHSTAHQNKNTSIQTIKETNNNSQLDQPYANKDIANAICVIHTDTQYTYVKRKELFF